MGPSASRREELVAPAWVGELGEVRERLARLETKAEAHDQASSERQRQLLDAVEGLEDRLEQVEGRAWKVALALAAGAGGAAGGLELVKSLLGG